MSNANVHLQTFSQEHIKRYIRPKILISHSILLLADLFSNFKLAFVQREASRLTFCSTIVPIHNTVSCRQNGIRCSTQGSQIASGSPALKTDAVFLWLFANFFFFFLLRKTSREDKAGILLRQIGKCQEKIEMSMRV